MSDESLAELAELVKKQAVRIDHLLETQSHLRSENKRLKWMFNSLSEELQEHLFDEWHIFCNAK